jgi:putative hemolysin
MPILTIVFYILGCILLIGFFAGTEIAFISANKLNIELRKKKGTFSGKVLARFAENPSEFIGTSLVGVNILVVIYGWLIAKATEHILTEIHYPMSEYVKLGVDTVFATIILLVFAEFLPKAIFRAKADTVLRIFSLPMLLMYYLLYPIAKIFVEISEFLLKYIFNVKLKKNKQVFNRVDLEVFVKQTIDGNEDDRDDLNAELFEKALFLARVKVRKCMVPRNEIEAVEITDGVDDARNKFIETKLSKIIVYDNSIDNIAGYIHHSDLNRNPTTIKEVLHKITPVPEAMSAVDLMNSFTKERRSIAWVIDEFGGTAGIVTMEDVLEKIFGDINDEYDVEEHVEKQIAENEYIFSGRLELDYLNEKYGFSFPTDDSETLSGFIITKHETIPNMNEKIVIDNYEFSILLVSNTRIETVKMKERHREKYDDA